MKNKKQPDVINNISMTIEDFYELKEKVDRAYISAGIDDIQPDNDFENDTINLRSVNGQLDVTIDIKLSAREIIEII